jgi:hypothetical protein
MFYVSRPGESRDPFSSNRGADKWMPAFAGTGKYPISAA